MQGRGHQQDTPDPSAPQDLGGVERVLAGIAAASLQQDRLDRNAQIGQERSIASASLRRSPAQGMEPPETMTRGAFPA
jgi:hypothetical protein